MELIIKPRNEEELLFVRSVLDKMRIKSELHERSEKKRRKKVFLDSFEQRVNEVNQAIRGEVTLKNAFDLLDEL